MDVVLQGKRYRITQESIEAVLKQEPASPQRYVVEVGDRRYPLKQAASAGLGVPPVAFTSQQAYGWLSRLGFDVIDLDQE